MSESTSPPVAGGPADHGAPGLTPEGIDAILADFRAWLSELAAGTVSAPEPVAAEPFDLSALVGQFTALRHEVNLQTRAARTQQEQNAEALRLLGEAVDTFQEAPEHSPDEDRPPPTLLKALIEVADALALARQEVERLAGSAGTLLDQVRVQGEPKADPRSLWARWLCGQRSAAADDRQQRSAGEAAERARQLLDSVVGGYRMSLQRLERALEQQGLTPIACAGLPFDPERMEAIEAVADSGRRPGEVVAVIRPGYEWNGKVFRYALVRVAKTADSTPGSGMPGGTHAEHR